MTPTQANDWLFDKIWGGLATFLDEPYSWKEPKARRLLAKWVHTHGPQLTAQAVMHIGKHKPMEPVSRAEAWFKAVHAKNAKKHRPGFRPPDNLPPIVPLDERVDHRRFAELRALLEESG